MEEKYMSLRAVKAGQAGKVIPTTAAVNLAILEPFLEEIGNDPLYYVSGESQAPEGIHTNDIIWAKKVDSFSEYALVCGDFIVLRIAKDKMIGSECDSNLKLRKFIKEFNMLSLFDNNNDDNIINEHIDSLWENLIKTDSYAQDDTQKQNFKDKLCIYINEHSEREDFTQVLVSVTYTSNGREFSFHPKKQLESKVKAFIDVTGNKKEV